MDKIRILLVDDEPSILTTFKILLTDAGYEVDTTLSALTALTLLGLKTFDLLIVDWRLGGSSGLDLVREVKTLQPSCALLMISTGATRETIIEAFRSDIDDFLIKPISREQLLQGVGRAMLKHQVRRDTLSNRSGDSLVYGAFSINIESRTILWHDELLKLTPTEYCLMLVLVQNAGRSISAQTLIKYCRGDEVDETHAQNLLKPHIANLRQKLEQDGRYPRVLMNHRGMGFLINSDG
jgi:DNA-binding response OmpR family regulator